VARCGCLGLWLSRLSAMAWGLLGSLTPCHGLGFVRIARVIFVRIASIIFVRIVRVTFLRIVRVIKIVRTARVKPSLCSGLWNS
jgi:hypothetical protein